MFANERNFKFEKGKAIHLFDEKYLSIRKEIISILQLMVQKLSFSQQTFYQALLYLDILLYKKREINYNKLKLVGVSCLILAGKLFKLI